MYTKVKKNGEGYYCAVIAKDAQSAAIPFIEIAAKEGKLISVGDLEWRFLVRMDKKSAAADQAVITAWLEEQLA